tara:strand:- start:54 stop:695 length:642 start_codon:yes stop_codon:yes gene_type:complete
VDPILYNEFKKIKIDPYETCKKYSLMECSHSFKDYIIIRDYIYFSDALKTINSNSGRKFLIEIKDIYTYPDIQFIELLLEIFQKVEYKFSRFTNACYVFCKGLKHELIIERMYVKDFSIKVNTKLLKHVFNYNCSFFRKITNLNEILTLIYNETLDMSLVIKDIEISNKYYISYINKSNIYKVCNCDKLFNSKLLDCYICEECLSLNSIININ